MEHPQVSVCPLAFDAFPLLFLFLVAGSFRSMPAMASLSFIIAFLLFGVSVSVDLARARFAAASSSRFFYALASASSASRLSFSAFALAS